MSDKKLLNRTFVDLNSGLTSVEVRFFLFVL